MRITKINSQINYKSNNDVQQTRPEFIDKLTDKIKNPKDVNDCVAVPRGIFKAYLFIMSGSALLSLASLIPQKAKWVKNTFIICGTALNLISAVYFAKPFAVKGLSPTIKPEKKEDKI